MPRPIETTTYQSFEVAADHLLVRLDPKLPAAAIAQILKGVGHIEGQVGDSGVYILKFDRPQALDKILAHLAKQPGVLLAEPDYVIRTADTQPDAGVDSTIDTFDVSNDPSVTNGTTWGMYGDTTARVNIWLNPNEIPAAFKSNLADTDADGRITFRDLNNAANAAYVTDNNGNGRIDGGDLLNDTRWEDGLDQDGNGLTDDLIGWDFINGDNDPMDDVGHGTHVAGTIAAQGATASAWRASAGTPS